MLEVGLYPQQKYITSSDPHNFPLVITNNSGNWYQGEYIANNANIVCLVGPKTSGSSAYWWDGVWGNNSNGYVIWFGCLAYDNDKGLTSTPHGDTIWRNKLDVGLSGDNQIKIHGTGAIISYAKFKASHGQDCTWDFQNPSNNNVWSNIKAKGITLIGFTPTGNLTLMHEKTRE